MAGTREPLKIIATGPHYGEGQSPLSDKYSVYLKLNRSLTEHERTVINTMAVPRPLGIGGANPQTLPRTMIIVSTTIEQVAAARDDIKEFLAAVEEQGAAVEQEATAKADQRAAAIDAETKRRQAIADSINWE